MIAAYRARRDERMVRRIEAAEVSMEVGTSPEWMRLRDAAMHRIGAGHMREMTSLITGIFLPMWRMRAYTLPEKINIWCGKLWSRPFFWEDMIRDDLSARLPQFEVPIHTFVGAHDLTANPALSRSYFDVIEAPDKAFHLFETSAQSPLFEEPERAVEILREIVADALARQAETMR